MEMLLKEPATGCSCSSNYMTCKDSVYLLNICLLIFDFPLLSSLSILPLFFAYLGVFFSIFVSLFVCLFVFFFQKTLSRFKESLNGVMALRLMVKILANDG